MLVSLFFTPLAQNISSCYEEQPLRVIRFADKYLKGRYICFQFSAITSAVWLNFEMEKLSKGFCLHNGCKRCINEIKRSNYIQCFLFVKLQVQFVNFV